MFRNTDKLEESVRTPGAQISNFPDELSESFILLDRTPSPAVNPRTPASAGPAPIPAGVGPAPIVNNVRENRLSPNILNLGSPVTSISEASESEAKTPEENSSPLRQLSPEVLSQLEGVILSFAASERNIHTPRDFASREISPENSPFIIHHAVQQNPLPLPLNAPIKDIFAEANAIRRAFYSVY